MALSEALKLGEGITLEHDDVQAIMSGFASMSETIQTSVEVIEDLEQKQAKKKRLWRPD